MSAPLAPIPTPRPARGLALAAAALLAACGPDQAEQDYLAALRGEETGLTRQAQIALLDQAIQQAPRRTRYWEARARYRIDLRQFDAARADLDRALELGFRPYLRFLRGLVWCQSGDPARGIVDFDVAISRDPGNTQFYRGRALARAALGQGEAALADARVLLERAPQMGESHYAHGAALATLGRYAEAVTAFDEALRRRPELVYALAARAQARARAGDSAGAAADEFEAARRAAERRDCAVCLDPFRY